MDRVPNLDTTQPGTPDRWLESLLHEARPSAGEQTFSALDAEFTARVIAALPARTSARSYWRLLPLAALLMSASLALWCLIFSQSTFTIDRPAALWLQLLPMAALYWLCWETCFAEPRSSL